MMGQGYACGQEGRGHQESEHKEELGLSTSHWVGDRQVGDVG